LTLGFWPAVISLIIFSPSVIFGLMGVVAVFALYFLGLVGYALHVDIRDRRTNQTPRMRQGRQRVSHGLS
jgi:hypothetical protein